jgi:RNA polymerase sigma factor (TIGR02999 family)
MPKRATTALSFRITAKEEFMDNHEVTQLLVQWQKGNKDALDRLLPLVYSEMHRMAAQYLRRERVDHTLQPTALINEAYLRLVGSGEVNCENRAHFFGIAARVMRRILVDHARQHQAEKRGGEVQKVPFDEANEPAAKQQDVNILALDVALTRLAEVDPEQSRLVELRYFAGLTIEDASQVMSMSLGTAKRRWMVAKAWLHREISRAQP